MRNMRFLVAILFMSMLVSQAGVFGQEVSAPVHQDGEWWRLKKELMDTRGGSSTECSFIYSDWLVKREAGQFKAFGMKENAEEAIDCPGIFREVFGISSEAPNYLKFPLKVGLAWSERYRSSRTRTWRYVEHKVESFEKVSTPKGEFEAFKISRVEPGVRIRGGAPFDNIYTYYYSPKTKSFVLFKNEAGQFYKLTTTLVDFFVKE